jgi:hypothetical protein
VHVQALSAEFAVPRPTARIAHATELKFSRNDRGWLSRPHLRWSRISLQAVFEAREGEGARG